MAVPEAFDRPDGKQATIQGALLERIVGGALPAGSRMPRRVDLEHEYQASRVTIQRVFDQLAEDGFVHANGRGGTFVVDHPPHLCRFVLAFPDDENGNRFRQALSQEARRLSTPMRTIEVRTNLHVARDQMRLLSDLRSRRVAGVVWVTPSSDIINGHLVQETAVPSVAISPVCMPRLPGIAPDMPAFMTRAVERLVKLGRKRIAMISVPGHANAHACAEIARHGLDFPQHWLQVVPYDHGHWVRNLVRLLFHRDQRERPDSLIISDDNLVEEATGGLIDAGVRVPSEVEIVAHCNFPWPTPSVVPVHRLGYDARVVLERCLLVLSGRRADAAVDAPIWIPPVFADERGTSP